MRAVLARQTRGRNCQSSSLAPLQGRHRVSPLLQQAAERLLRAALLAFVVEAADLVHHRPLAALLFRALLGDRVTKPSVAFAGVCVNRANGVLLAALTGERDGELRATDVRSAPSRGFRLLPSACSAVEAFAALLSGDNVCPPLTFVKCIIVKSLHPTNREHTGCRISPIVFDGPDVVLEGLRCDGHGAVWIGRETFKQPVLPP